jgi:DNA polymerase III subunit beta
MKLKTSKESFLSRLQIVARAVSTRTAVQALAGVLLTAEDGGARLKATDMELALDVGVETEIEGTGTVVLPGRLLVEVVRSLPEKTLSLAVRQAERDVEISSGGASFHLRTLAAEEFPKLPDPGDERLTLPAAALRSTVDRVARAASRDEARPILTGILVTAEEGVLTMVATDSYRLAVKRTELEQPVESALEANVPARALRELSRIAEGEEIDSIEISLLPNQAVFTAGEITLSSRLIEGQFPNYRQLLPESYQHEVRLPREEFLEVVRRVSLLAQKNAPLRLAFSEGELTVSAETPDLGAASEKLPVGFQGEPLEIGFNPEYLRDGIELVDSDELVLKLISPLRPGLLQPLDRDDFSYLAMPIRLNV